MNDAKMTAIKSTLMMATLVATAPAWAQSAEQTGAAARSTDAILNRLEAVTRELEMLKAQVKVNEDKANRNTEPGLARPAVETIAAKSSAEAEPEGGALLKLPKATLKFYGMIDVGAESLTGKLANGNDAKAIRISNGIITPHYGLLGTGKLSQGLQGSFHLEGSFAPDNGVSGIGGRLFGRQSWVGLSGGFGTVRFGRQYTAVRIGWEDANPYGTGNQGLRLLDPRISNPRADNAISYIGQFGPVTAALNYSPGWDAVNGNASNTGPANAAGANCAGEVPTVQQQCKEHSMALKYSGASWSVATAYEVLRGGTAATFGGLTTPSKTDTRFVLSGNMKLKGGTRLTAGWIKRDNEGSVTPKSDMHWAEAIIPLGGPWFFDSAVARLKYQDSVNKAVLVNLRGRYLLNEDTTLYVAVSNMDNSGSLALAATASTPAPAPLAGENQTSVIAGIRYKF